MFDIPSREDVAKVVVTKEAVDGAANPQLFLADGQEAS